MRDPKCVLCQALKDEWLLDYYAGFAIITTKNMKGHSERCMVISSDHRRQVMEPEKDTAIALLFRYLLKHYNYDWAIMESTHASIPEHWHMVATTLDVGEDQELIEDTDRIEIRFKRREK